MKMANEPAERVREIAKIIKEEVAIPDVLDKSTYGDFDTALRKMSWMYEALKDNLSWENFLYTGVGGKARRIVRSLRYLCQLRRVEDRSEAWGVAEKITALKLDDIPELVSQIKGLADAIETAD